MDNPVSGYFSGRLHAFKTSGNCDEVASMPDLVLQVTEAGNGFVEVMYEDRNEQVYVAFRVSDLLRAVKESKA